MVKAISPVFGGINLEDISAPRCFEIEDRLRDELDIPVFHDDQHGTAIVTLAALHNAAEVVGKRLDELRVVVTGVGAAGVAVTKMLLAAGVPDVVGCDRAGRRPRRAAGADPGQGRVRGVDEPAPRHGVGGRRARRRRRLHRPLPARRGHGGRDPLDGRRPIVFAMANPTPEVLPEEIEGVAAVIGTGRSDYPNQINNVLAFPGVFRGALDVRATAITDGMKLAAAEAIAAVVQPDELEPDYVIPSVFNRDVAVVVAEAVARAAEEAGVARRRRAVAQPV